MQSMTAYQLTKTVEVLVCVAHDAKSVVL